MLATHYKFVTIVIYIVMFIVEMARLYLGYEGNLREKVCTIHHTLLSIMLEYIIWFVPRPSHPNIVYLIYQAKEPMCIMYVYAGGEECQGAKLGVNMCILSGL